MRIAIIHSVSGLSAKYLKEYLVEAGHRVDIFRPYVEERSDFTEYDKVVSLGCSAKVYTKPNAHINTGTAIKLCVDKRLTFASFNKANVPTVEWTTDFKKIPKHWDQVVVRMKVDGRKAEDINYFSLPDELRDVPKDAALYTQCHYGRFEYRIVVLSGKVVGRYFKALIPGGEWEFRLQNLKGFEEMDKQCINAAKALGIDYVGLDVLAHSKKDFVILEANSGATVQHESAVAFVELFRK